jgi:hypothetical protein
MTDETEPMVMDRRDLIARAVFLVGGAAALASLEACAPARKQGPFFDRARRRLLDQISDVMIPATDTPGALGAQVPAFIDSMMTNWASRERQSEFIAALDAIDARARSLHNAAFTALTAEQKLDVLRRHDAEGLAEDSPYRQLKELTLLGYYSSEIGATQELRYELVPGAWRADIPLTEVGRAWAF